MEAGALGQGRSVVVEESEGCDSVPGGGVHVGEAAQLLHRGQEVFPVGHAPVEDQTGAVLSVDGAQAHAVEEFGGGRLPVVGDHEPVQAGGDDVAGGHPPGDAGVDLVREASGGASVADDRVRVDGLKHAGSPGGR